MNTYTVQRSEGKYAAAMVAKDGTPMFLCLPLESFLVWREGQGVRAERVADLSDQQLLIALTAAVDLGLTRTKTVNLLAEAER